MSNFTVKINPFTGELLTDVNTVYVDADTGNDINAGTKASPLLSISQMLTAVKPNMVVRGVFNGNYTVKVDGSVDGYLLGDLNTVVNGIIDLQYGTGAGESRLYVNNINVLQLTDSWYQSMYLFGRLFINNCKVSNVSVNGNNSEIFTSGSIIENIVSLRSHPSISMSVRNVYKSFRTIVATNATQSTWYPVIFDSIFTDSITIIVSTLAIPQFIINNSIIRKQCKWFYGTIQIPITWTVPGGELNDLQDSLLAFADTANVAVGAKDAYIAIVNAIFGIGTTVYDDSSPNVRIFNKYDLADNVLDYSLNMQEGNPALTKSISLGRIGAWFPKYNIIFNSPVEITDAGVETGNAGNLLVENDGIFIDLTSSQQRNKMETNVLSLPGGDVFKKWQSSFAQSTSSDIYLGAKQILTAGQHPVNAILVTPYDTPLLPSSYPKFLAPINSEVELAYLSGSPVLFNDLAGLGIITNKNLAECGDWAVSNACHEWIELTELPGVTVEHPKFRHFVLTVIANSFA